MSSPPLSGIRSRRNSQGRFQAYSYAPIFRVILAQGAGRE
jgi:hypothetical protein